MFSFALFFSLSVCLTVCVCLTLCMCLCLHMFNYQPPPSLWSTPQCHATISLHCGCNLNFSHTYTHQHTLAGLQIVKSRQFCRELLYSPLKWSSTHVQREWWREKRRNMKNKTKKRCRAAEHYSTTHLDWSTTTSGVQTVIVWTKQTTYKHKASALRGSYLGPSVNSKAQNESIKRALRWFLFI